MLRDAGMLERHASRSLHAFHRGSGSAAEPPPLASQRAGFDENSEQASFIRITSVSWSIVALVWCETIIAAETRDSLR